MTDHSILPEFKKTIAPLMAAYRPLIDMTTLTAGFLHWSGTKASDLRGIVDAITEEDIDALANFMMERGVNSSFELTEDIMARPAGRMLFIEADHTQELIFQQWHIECVLALLYEKKMFSIEMVDFYAQKFALAMAYFTNHKNIDLHSYLKDSGYYEVEVAFSHLFDYVIPEGGEREQLMFNSDDAALRFMVERTPVPGDNILPSLSYYAKHQAFLMTNLNALKERISAAENQLDYSMLSAYDILDTKTKKEAPAGIYAAERLHSFITAHTKEVFKMAEANARRYCLFPDKNEKGQVDFFAGFKERQFIKNLYGYMKSSLDFNSKTIWISACLIKIQESYK